MLNIKRKLSKKGFSLIELMVAVAILALAIFGIFHAYSTGFMGMADARDRTVASNYAREAMEDVKNMDFEKIETTTKSVITSNIKYRVDVNVSLENENPNLKKVFTIVSWKDRNGVGKTVETSMLVNYTEIYATAATKIVLYADSYTILSGSTTNITAVIKDIKGNTVIGWDGDNISFSIQPVDEYGNLKNITTTTKGIAKATFTYNGTVGIGEINVYVIEASVTLRPPDGSVVVVSDSVTIKVTDGPVKIGLMANPDIIKSNSTDCSTITVSLQNAAGVTLKKNMLVSDIEITFNVFGDFDEGDLSNSTIIITPGSSEEDAVGTINLCPTSKRGLATVMATATDLESDTVDIRFLGPPASISISANPNSIYVDDIEGSTVSVSLLDVNGFSTNPTEDPLSIPLTLETSVGVGGELGGGDLIGDSFIFLTSESEGITKTTTFSGQESTGTAKITASDGGSMENSVNIIISSALVPEHITLTASPEIVKADGVSISTIKATVYDVKEKIVTNYIGTITFYKDGIFFSTNSFNKGIATITLSSESTVTITITASSDDLDCLPSEGVEVGFYKVADRIELTASPEIVKADGVSTSTITATVYDDNIIVLDYDKPITFYKDGIFFSTNSFNKGIATITLSSESTVTITITAFSDDLDCLPLDGVEVKFYEETDLILVEKSAYYDSANLIVGFKVDVVGEVGVKIRVDEMKIIWTESGPQERFSKIVIDDDEVVYTGNVKSGTIVAISPNQELSIGEYIIELTFLQDMAERQIDVMFYPPSGWYLIRFDVPLSP